MIRLVLAVAILPGSAASGLIADVVSRLNAPAADLGHEGFYHSHGAGEMPHWHPFPVAEKPAERDRRKPSPKPGYEQARNGAHDHAAPQPSMSATAVISLACSPQQVGAALPVRIPARLILSTPIWRAVGPRGPPLT